MSETPEVDHETSLPLPPEEAAPEPVSVDQAAALETLDPPGDQDQPDARLEDETLEEVADVVEAAEEVELAEPLSDQLSAASQDEMEAERLSTTPEGDDLGLEAETDEGEHTDRIETADETNEAEENALAEPSDEWKVVDPDSEYSDTESKVVIEPNGTVIRSDLRTWRNKLYLGGYRHKKSGIEYFHAYAQTTTPQDIQAVNRGLRFHRDSQTVDIANHKSQTTRESGTQMRKPGCHITIQTNYIIKSKQYVTSDEWEATRHAKAIIIQCFVRQIQARLKVRKLLEIKRAKTKAYEEKEERRQKLLEKKRVQDNERRLHPKTDKDFEILYSGLEQWRTQETSRINKLQLIEPARLAALADLLDQESALLQKIDKLKIDASIENREKSVVNLLERGQVVHVDTPNIIRARELRDLYHAINFPMLSVDERLQILLHVKFTAKEFDCNLTREIVDLIDREGDLISRGRSEKSLEGLRKRISNLFLQFIQTPEFNPEMGSHIKLFKMDHQPWKEAAVYYCRGCTKYKSSTEFYLSTTLKHLGKCKDCSMKENLAIQKIDDSSYGSMLKMIRMQEAVKRRNNPTEGYNAMALLQESDLRYLIDVVWSRKSAISGVRNLEDLTLTRWDIHQELSPWNCILLTKTESATHDCQEHPDAVYSVEFRNKIFQKQLMARQHFGQLPAMSNYLKENYKEDQGGRLVPKEGARLVAA
ncbi:hypothetical protein HDU91_006235 [Kappamyces sp. JEL0680]|nr:hypothetical protein HDU91_006235 [Kappamyces sp. JEL0680]